MEIPTLMFHNWVRLAAGVVSVAARPLVLAADLGLTTALLDPIEAQVDPEADYRDVMRANLENLATALDCP